MNRERDVSAMILWGFVTPLSTVAISFRQKINNNTVKMYTVID